MRAALVIYVAIELEQSERERKTRQQTTTNLLGTVAFDELSHKYENLKKIPKYYMRNEESS